MRRYGIKFLAAFAVIMVFTACGRQEHGTVANGMETAKEQGVSENFSESIGESTEETAKEGTQEETGENGVVSLYEIPDAAVIESVPELIRNALAGKQAVIIQGERLESIDELFRRFVADEHFSILDFDKDGLNEVVLYDEPSYIFHTDGEMVYVYERNYRGILQLKTDGSFSGSGGASSEYYMEFTGFTETEFQYRVYVNIEGYIDGEKGPFCFDGIRNDEGVNSITLEEAEQLIASHSQELAEKYAFSKEYFE